MPLTKFDKNKDNIYHVPIHGYEERGFVLKVTATILNIYCNLLKFLSNVDVEITIKYNFLVFTSYCLYCVVITLVNLTGRCVKLCISLVFSFIQFLIYYFIKLLPKI
jgi:hypothetical protein